MQPAPLNPPNIQYGQQQYVPVYPQQATVQYVQSTSSSTNKDIPPSTDLVIVFPRINSKNFDAQIYNPSLTNNRADTANVQAFLNEADNVLSKYLDTQCCGDCFVCLLFLAVIAVLILVCTGSINFDPLGDYGITAGLFLFLVVSCVCNGRNERAKVSLARMEINGLLQTKYSYFRSSGLRWHMPTNFPKWIELWRDYVEEEPYGNVGTYQPPAQVQFTNVQSTQQFNTASNFNYQI